MSTFYDLKARRINGREVSMEDYRGKVLVVVNTASKCGFTPQYEDLQKLYETYKDQGLEILGFPCNQFGEQEPGSSDEVSTFCQLNYGVSFPLFEKTDVRGPSLHPVFQYLTESEPFRGFDLSTASGKMLNAFLLEKHPEFMSDDSIKWNFTKFLIDREGHIIARYEPTAEPLEMEPQIQELLQAGQGQA